MSNRTLNLQTYTVEDIKKDMVQIFDEDYNGGNGNEYWELDDLATKDGEIITKTEKLGYETEADRFIDEIYDEDADDVTNIEAILDKVGECWGSQASQFTYSVTPCGYDNNEYVISIAMLN